MLNILLIISYDQYNLSGNNYKMSQDKIRQESQNAKIYQKQKIEQMNQSQKQTELVQKTNIQTQLLPVKQSPYIYDQTIIDQIQPASYSQLFYFADRLDYVIMIIATLFSLGNGVSIVFYSIPIKDLINVFSDNVPKDQIVQATLRSVYGFLINSAILFVNCWLMTAGWVITSERQMNRARKQYFAALLKQEIAWHDRTKPAQICSKMYVQISKVQQGLVTNMTSVLNKISMGVSGIIMALAVGYQMALVMIGFLPVMMASGFIRGYFTKQKDMYLQTKKVKLDSDVIEVFDNIKTVKMLASEDYESERYQKLVHKQEQTLWSHGWKGSLAFTFFFFCIIANYALGFWYGTKMVADQVINKNTGNLYNVGQVIVIFFTLYISNLSLSGLPDSIASFSVSRYSMKKILAIVSRVPRIKDGHISMPDNIDSILFKNVWFSYDRPLFENLTLKLQKGVTALIGQSGCGKSTIISLLMRFYDVGKGAIELNCKQKVININELTNDSLRQKIGYVGQQPILIGKTIRQVLMAQQYSDQNIYEVLELVKADKFVREIGLYAEYKSVSGGQKQRLAIARALLKKPKILILDESTSALDHKTEQQVLNNLIKCGIDYIIMIAHRYSTLKYANTIIKLNKSNIQFSTTYQQLTSKNLINISEQNEQTSQLQAKIKKSITNQIQESIDVVKQKIEKSLQKQQQKKDEPQLNRFNDLVFEIGYIMRLIKLNKDKWFLYLLGVIGAIYFGCIFPVFSYLISKIIFILQNIAAANPQTLPIYQDQAHKLATLLFLISFGSLIFTTMRWVIFEYFNERIGFIVKSTGFRKLIHKNYPEIEQEGSHTYSYMINKSCQDLKPLAGNFLPMIIQNLITLVVGLGIAFVYSWQITGVSLLIMPLILLSSKMMMSFNHGMQSNTEQIHKKNHELVITSIMHLRTVRSCNLESRICAKYGKELDDALKASVKYGNLSGILFGIGQTLISCTFAVIFLIGSVMIKNDIINVQDLYTAIFAVMFAGVQAGGNLYFLGQLEAAKTGASVYFQIIDKNSAEQAFIEDLSDPAMKQLGADSVKFQNVKFGYETRNQNIFKNFNLAIKNNEKVAIVGESGSGKSSITNLLFRLYNPKDGVITIDGQELNKISRNKLSKVLGIVMQEPALFNRSVYENLRYNNADVSDEEIMEVVKSVNAYDFIVDGNFGLDEEIDKETAHHHSSLHHAFSRVVGPRGSYLSGGQKQRISIARALIRKPKILVLDQATSALDGQNQKIIQQTISKMNNITQIIIAHRLQTIRDCDRIVVLNNGNIIEEGSYSQLIQKNGYFAVLSLNKQLSQ